MKSLLLALFFISPLAYSKRFIVEAKYPLSQHEIKNAGHKISLFSPTKYPDKYFSRLYVVEGDISGEKLKHLPWVKSIEEGVHLSVLSLLPAPSPRYLVSDELFSYQWGLLNQGQTFLREKDDIHNLPLLGTAGSDIGWKLISPATSQKRPVVAILDSGVDLDHPDLEGNLWKNEIECAGDPQVDNDKNNYPGDCHGRNFTVPRDSQEANNPQDLDGHGTHVAGIVAAANNGVGIVGVNPSALIMPIKVLSGTQSRSQVAASESFAMGIIYATDMGADIINLSLGWPRSLETTHLRNAINYALNKNVIIVAAAGNNNSSSPLLPCAYDGVICAAASTLDGHFAGFSNYGGHIDSILPGEGILSLYPGVFAPELFSIPGYDIKSGTSQSAPLLSGLISILKSQDPQLTINETFARLYQAKENPDQRKFILGGDLKWEEFSRPLTGPVVRPVLKRLVQIVLEGESQLARVNLPVRNYGPQGDKVTLKVSSLTDGLEILTREEELLELAPNQAKLVPMEMRFRDLFMESFIKLKITLVSSEGERSFVHELPVVRDVKNESKFSRLPFKFNSSQLPIGNIEDGKVISFLSTLETYGHSSRGEYFLRRIQREEKKLTLTLFRRTSQALEEAPQPIVIENFISLANFLKLDLNFDGKEDYLVQAVVEDSKGVRDFAFFFFDQDLNPLWSAFPSAKVSLDLLIKGLSQLHFIRHENPILGPMMVPVIFTEGELPKLDQKMDFFGRWDKSREPRLYYLEPMVEEKLLRIRTLTGQSWSEGVREELKASWQEKITVENILPPTSSNVKEGKVSAIMSLSLGNKKRFFISTFDSLNVTNHPPLRQIGLDASSLRPLYFIGPKGLEVSGEVFINIYDRTQAKVVVTKDGTKEQELRYNHSGETDFIQGQIAALESTGEKFFVLESRDKLIAVTQTENASTPSSRPKLRYSFFSSEILSEMYTPVIYNRDQKRGALYVDSTGITRNRVYLFENQQGQLVSSIQNSLMVPFETRSTPSGPEVVIACRPLNPQFQAEAGAHEFTFLCLENKQWFLRSYPMR
jgi:cell wall-associated protease